jgi:DnaJ-class molecular chaperone
MNWVRDLIGFSAKIAVIPAVICLLLFTALADTIVLQDGTKVDGTIVEETKDYVKVKFRFGETTYSRKDIKEIIRSQSKEDIYKEKLGTMDKDSEQAHLELAKWCEENGMRDLAEKHRSEARRVTVKKKLAEGYVICPDCNGDGQYACCGCEGKGSVKQMCKQCGGTGRIECPGCYGKEKLICPGCKGIGSIAVLVPRYGWEEKTDICPSCGGSGCSRCNGTGVIVRRVSVQVGWDTGIKKCDTCSGSGVVKCTRCEGKGTLLCPMCKNVNKSKIVRCVLCNGKGKFTCTSCSGEGTLDKEGAKIVREEKAKKLQGAPEVIAAAKKAVVVIDTEKSLGAGFLVSADGSIITCAHCVQDAITIRVGLLQDKAIVWKDATLLCKDQSKDLALVKIKEQNLPFLRLIDSAKNVQQAEEVFLIGHPEALGYSVSKGIVSAVREGRNGLVLVQHTAESNPGNSGGPLLNSKGEVIGVHSRKVSEAEGLNFAIGANHIVELLQQSAAERKK